MQIIAKVFKRCKRGKTGDADPIHAPDKDSHSSRPLERDGTPARFVEPEVLVSNERGPDLTA